MCDKHPESEPSQKPALHTCTCLYDLNLWIQLGSFVKESIKTAVSVCSYITSDLLVAHLSYPLRSFRLQGAPLQDGLQPLGIKGSLKVIKAKGGRLLDVQLALLGGNSKAILGGSATQLKKLRKVLVLGFFHDPVLITELIYPRLMALQEMCFLHVCQCRLSKTNNCF